MRTQRRSAPLLIGAAAALGLGIGLGALAGSASAAQTFVLDVSNPANTTQTGALKTAKLEMGETYVLTVTGTGSMWPAAQMAPGSPVCGSLEAGPIAPSPGRANAGVGVDAQTLFGAPAGTIIAPNLFCGAGSAPRNSTGLYTGFEMMLTSGTWSRPAPIGGRRSVPRADHTYVYELTGTGAAVSFRFVDSPSDDNYGLFGLTLMTAAECAKVSCQGVPGGSGFQAGREGDSRLVTAPTPNPATGPVTTLPTCATTYAAKLKTRSGVKLKSATFKASGKTLATVKGTALGRQVKLRKLPAKSFKLTVTAKTTAGQTVKTTQSVAGCRKASKTPVSLNLR